MTLRMFLFLLAVLVLLIALSTATAVTVRRMRRNSSESWETLFQRLKVLNRENLARVALDLENLPVETPELTASDIWELAGGMRGLAVIELNCAVLIDMAFYLQRWYPEAVVVAEQLRLHAREIEWHVSRLKGAEQTGHLDEAFGTYGQRAVAVYYRMTRAVLELYDATGLPEAAVLKAAL